MASNISPDTVFDETPKIMTKMAISISAWAEFETLRASLNEFQILERNRNTTLQGLTWGNLASQPASQLKKMCPPWKGSLVVCSKPVSLTGTPLKGGSGLVTVSGAHK